MASLVAPESNVIILAEFQKTWQNCLWEIIQRTLALCPAA